MNAWDFFLGNPATAIHMLIKTMSSATARVSNVQMQNANARVSNVNAHCCAATEQLLAFPELPCGTNVFVLPEIFEVALGAATRSTRKYVTTKIP